jgi:hypothetical protein
LANINKLNQHLVNGPFIDLALTSLTCKLYHEYGHFLAPIETILLTSNFVQPAQQNTASYRQTEQQNVQQNTASYQQTVQQNTASYQLPGQQNLQQNTASYQLTEQQLVQQNATNY